MAWDQEGRSSLRKERRDKALKNMKGVGIFIQSKIFLSIWAFSFWVLFFFFLSKFLMELQQQLTAAHVTHQEKTAGSD